MVLFYEVLLYQPLNLHSDIFLDCKCFNQCRSLIFMDHDHGAWYHFFPDLAQVYEFLDLVVLEISVLLENRSKQTFHMTDGVKILTLQYVGSMVERYCL